MKVEAISTATVTVLALIGNNKIVTVVGIIVTFWGLLNQFATNKKRVERDFNGNWKSYFKWLFPIKKKHLQKLKRKK